MTEHDDDLGFEFFEEEPSTQEAVGTQRLPRIVRRPPGPPRPPRPPAGITPLMRLVGLIAFAILIIVLLVFWIQSCQGASKRSSFSSYMEQVAEVGKTSQNVGGGLNKLLTEPGVKESDLESQLNGLAQRQQQIVSRAQGIDPPGQLRTEQQAVVQALQFRVSGLRGLEDAFRRTAASTTDADQASEALSTQAQRLLASDVIWDDLFKAPSVTVLKREGVAGVPVPDSTFLSTPDFAGASTMKVIWQRVHGASTGGGGGPGLHGTGIAGVKALPSGTELSQDTETTITAVPGLAFEVSVEDTGDSQEVSIEVTLTIQKSPKPIVRKDTIDIIQPGETKTVTFRDLGQPPFGQRTAVDVDITPVPGEENTANNTAEYPVIFSLQSP
jgi:hypothetical protein